MRARLALALLLTLAGCASTPPPLEQSELFALEPVRPADRPLPGSAVIPLGASTASWAEEGADGEPIVRAMEATDRFRAQWWSTELDARDEFLAVDDEGRIVLTATIDRKEKALTVFEPPLVVMWPELRPGEAMRSESSMRVYDTGRRRKLKESGQAAREITYAGMQVAHLHGAIRDLHRIEILFTADLSLADVRRTDTIFVDPEDGPLIQRSSETVTVLGVLPAVTHRTIVREE